MAQLPHRNSLFSLGAAYYPDYLPALSWSRKKNGEIEKCERFEKIRHDLARMREAGLKVLRVGEFSWSSVEPRRGEFFPELFDATLESALQNDLKVIFCTPTATPPKWLCDEHPSLLPQSRQGQTMVFGSRRHYDVHNEIYQQESARITRIYAKQWGRHPAVVGWQTDNEFGCHNSVFLFSPASRKAFVIWLKERYFHNIENLNTHWFTGFWSQKYTDFHQIELPYSNTFADQNPSLELDFRRFSNEAWRTYQKKQVEILQEESPGRFVTHNFMTNFTDLCPWTLSEDIDLAGFDHYQMEPVPHPLTSHHNFALMKSLRNRRFWVLEQQPPQVNWQPTNRRFAFDWLFLWGMQSAFLGARGMLYFSWQKMYGGAEQYHDGVVPHDVRVPQSSQEKMLLFKNRVFSCLEQTFGWKKIPETSPDVLCIHSFESLWTHEITAQSHYYTTRKQLDYISALCTRHGWGLHFAPTIEQARAQLSQYKAIVLPGFAFELTKREREAIRRFMDSGGKVLSLPRTAMKQKNNQMSPFPGSFFAEDDFYLQDAGALLPGECEVCEDKHGNIAWQGHLWAEKWVLQNPLWQTCAEFQGGLYHGFPAAFCRESDEGGKNAGKWLHFATCPMAGDSSFDFILNIWQMTARTQALIPWKDEELGPQTQISQEPQGPLQAIPLQEGRRQFVAFVNFGKTPQTLTLHKAIKKCFWASWKTENEHEIRQWQNHAHKDHRNVHVKPFQIAVVELNPDDPLVEETNFEKKFF
jgi:beta-galactosidase